MFYVSLILFLIILVLLLIPENRIVKDNPYEVMSKSTETKKKNKSNLSNVAIWRTVVKVTRRFDKVKMPISPKSREKIEKNIIYAGLYHFLYVEDISVAKALILGILALYFLLLFVASGEFLMLFLGIITAILGYFLPETLLKMTAERRQDELNREFPNMLTSLAIITDAGLNLVPAMEVLISQQREKSVFIEELSKTLEEIRIGIPQKEAFTKMSQRTSVDEVRYFVSAIIQGLEKGNAGLTEIIRSQATESWNKRKLKAKELADKASIKLFLPLLCLVFPAFAIFLMGPMIFTLVNLFSIM